MISVDPHALTPGKLKRIFRFQHLPLDGKGETIAIIEKHRSFNTSGLAAFDLKFHLPPLNVNCKTHINCYIVGKPTATSKPPHIIGEETMLDVEWAHAIAPKARIVVLQWNFASRKITKALSLVHPNVISISFSSTNNYALIGLRSYGGDPFAALTKYNTFVSTGDTGSGPGAPSGLPGMIAIGGLQFNPSLSLARKNLIVWNHSTGGYEDFAVPKPPWQVGNKSPWRGIPDMSFVAGWPYLVVSDHHRWLAMNGTSAATPILASIWALGDQLHNNIYRTHLPEGEAPQILYKIASEHPRIFTQPNGGNNGQYKPTGIWNPAAGLGVPHITSLVHFLGHFKGKVESQPAIRSYTYSSLLHAFNNATAFGVLTLDGLLVITAAVIGSKTLWKMIIRGLVAGVLAVCAQMSAVTLGAFLAFNLGPALLLPHVLYTTVWTSLFIFVFTSLLLYRGQEIPQN